MIEIHITPGKKTILSEDITSITSENVAVINTLAISSSTANNIKSTKETEKNESIRSTRNAIAALLESPNGLTKGELMSAADSENIISAVLKIRNYLLTENVYQIKKFTKGKQIIYRLHRT